jgi:predicted MFS family arabinose efflux permease
VIKKKLPLILFIICVVFSAFIFINKDRIRLVPWVPGADLEAANFASGNEERIAIIDNSEMTVLALTKNKELIYKLNANPNSETGFAKAQIALFDEENNLYLYDKRFGGIQEENVERIIKYSPRGKYLGELYSYRYINNDFILSKGKISGMAWGSGSLYFIRLENDGMYLEKTAAVPGGPAEQVAFVPYPHSFRELAYSHINPLAGRFAVTTKTGAVKQYTLLGLKKIGFISALLIVTGNGICFIAANTTHLAVAYALTGFSGGALILVFNTIIGGRKDVESVNRGFAHLSASYLAGINVGVVFGSILAQFFSYRTVYLFSSVSAGMLFLIVLYFIRAKHLNSLFVISFFKDRRKWALLKFLVRPITLAALLLLLLPFMISQNFVQYFMPLFAINNGLRESNIGQLIMLNGLFAILFGTSLCEYAAKKFSPKVIVAGSLLLNLAAIYFFTLFMTISVLVFVIVLLAIANIFAITNLQTYYATLYQKTRTSSVKALSAYSAVENLSMAIGPVVFSYILAGKNLATGLRFFAAALLGCLLLFLVISLFVEKKKEKQ